MDRGTDVVTVQAESSQLVDGIRVFVQCINKTVSSGLDTAQTKLYQLSCILWSGYCTNKTVSIKCI